MSKPKGRPTVDPTQGSIPVTLAIPNATHDKARASARAQRVTVNDVIRAALDRYVRGVATSTRSD